MEPTLDKQTEMLLVLKDIRFWIKFWSIVGIIGIIIAVINFIMSASA
jgi:hypothetical protein